MSYPRLAANLADIVFWWDVVPDAFLRAVLDEMLIEKKGDAAQMSKRQETNPSYTYITPVADLALVSGWRALVVCSLRAIPDEVLISEISHQLRRGYTVGFTSGDWQILHA